MMIEGKRGGGGGWGVDDDNADGSQIGLCSRRESFNKCN